MKRTALTLWFVAAAVLVAANSYVCYVNVGRLIGSGERVTRSRSMIMATDAVIASLVDAETGERGYLITEAQDYLVPYRKARQRIDAQLEDLAKLAIDDDPVEAGQVAELKRLAGLKIAELEDTIAVRDHEGFEAAQRKVLEHVGQMRMNQAREVADRVRKQEQGVLTARTRERQAAAGTAMATLLGAGVFNLMLLGGIAVVVVRDARSRARAAEQQVRRLEVERDNARLAAEVEERQRVNAVLTALTTRLEQSNRELQDFASVASHDLQETLRKIQAFGDRLRSKFAEPLGADGRDYVDRMHSAAARMQTLINDLLSFSRVSTRAQPFAAVDLNGVVREVVGDLEARIESSGGTVEVGQLPTIEADAVQMRQLFQNLIANALKFKREGVAPVVSVTASMPGAMPTEVGTPANGDGHPGNVEIRVADNGIGFEEKYLDRIFNVFQRLHGREQYEGTGIGLAVCRKIAERHGGSITASSRPGEGTTFIVTLPVSHPERAAEGEATDAESAAATAAAAAAITASGA
jgi:signal transduction histidine kinase